MDGKSSKRLGLAALTLAALTSPVLVHDANAAGSSTGSTPPGTNNAVVLGNQNKPLNNNYIESGKRNGIIISDDQKLKNNNAIVLGNDKRPLDNNRFIVGRDGKYHDARHNNAIVLGNDGRALDNNRYVIGRDGKYHDAQHNNAIILMSQIKSN